MKTRPNRTPYLVAGLISALTFLVYLPTLGNEFVNWDDGDYVYENPHIQKLNIQFFRWAFCDFHAGNWHPLTWMSHGVDYALWGLDPLGHHLMNNLLHAANVFLVFFLAIRLLDVYEKRTNRTSSFSVLLNKRSRLFAGATAGLLFGIHPLHVESVAWISERKDLLCAFFSLLSMLSYLKYASADKESAHINRGPIFYDNRYLPAFGFFVLALLSKPMAVTLPVVFLILDWYPSGRIKSARTLMDVFMEKLPFFFLSLFSSVITFLAQRSGRAIVPLEETTVAVRLLVGVRALTMYLAKFFLPVDLLPFYPYPKDVSLLSLKYLIPLLLVAGITAACIASAKKQKWWLAIWLYYVITLLPVLGIIQVGGQAMADRYTYLPTLGLFILAGFGAALLMGKVFDLVKWRALVRTMFIGAGGLLVIMLSYATIGQAGIWKNSIALWSYLIETEPQKIPLAYYNRGLVYGKSNQLDLSINDFSNAISISPRFDLAYNNRGAAYFLEGNYDKAFESLNKAIELNKNNAEAYINRAYVYLKTDNTALAIPDLQEGCALGQEVGCDLLRYLSAK
jgi:protein O-mannosyl-transferase